MLFTSLIFIFLFLPLTILIYYICPGRTAKNIFLLIASLFFYAWGEPKYVLLMLISILMNWFFGLLVDKVRKNRTYSLGIMGIAVVANLLMIFVFKYLDFTIININHIFGLNIPTQNLPLPIGISFYTFQALSYVIDVYRENEESQKNPLAVGLYISFFPQLIAGPIVRYTDIASQIKERKETLAGLEEGSVIFLRGFMKKILLSNNFAIVADRAFSTPTSELSVAFAWLGAIAYTLQIFFDFSGYSEMAIGLGKMFGFTIPKNFEYPYISKSVAEFWRRWHITLGSWFRDYVYIPLGGNRKGKSCMLFNTFMVWLLTGIWHGANWTFIVWGLMYFVLISFEKITGLEKNKKIPMTVRHIYTMFFVILGWVIFRADSLSAAVIYIKTMLGRGIFQAGLSDYMFRFYAIEYLPFFLIGFLISTPVIKKISEKWKICNVIRPVFYALGFLVCISYLAKSSYNPFIYFNF